MMVLRSGPPPRLDESLAIEMALNPSVSWMYNNPPLDYVLEDQINKHFGIDVSDVLDAAFGRLTPRPDELTYSRSYVYGLGGLRSKPAID